MCHLIWKRIRLAVLSAAFAASTPLTAGVAASGISLSPYQAIDLSPNQDGIAIANAISSSGVIAGYFDANGLVKYFGGLPAIFVPGGFTLLNNVPGFPFGQITGINDAGQAAGWVTTEIGPMPGIYHAALFFNGQAIDLGALADGGYSEAYAINAAGDAVGFSDVMTTNGQERHAVLFSHGAIKDLGTLPGSSLSVATAINNRGQAVGYASTASGFTHAVLFANGTVTDLGTLPEGSNSIASGINDLGQVVGRSDYPGIDTYRAVLFENGTVQNLGTAPGGTSSFASGINNFGQVVGTSDGNGLGFNPALFQNGTAILLPDLPTHLFGNANAINDAGQIVGTTTFFPEGSEFHAVLWTLAHQFVLPRRPLR
jgi:probable HAF family extracellular repeat protein